MSEEKFSPNSRYYTLEQQSYIKPGGEEVLYLKRRFVPRPGGMLIAQHSVEEGDRPDSLANKYLNDPQQYWRLCDVNGTMRANDLVDEVGEIVDIRVPIGNDGSP